MGRAGQGPGVADEKENPPRCATLGPRNGLACPTAPYQPTALKSEFPKLSSPLGRGRGVPGADPVTVREIALGGFRCKQDALVSLAAMRLISTPTTGDRISWGATE